VAVLAEVSGSPAEPLGYRAAELALELYIVGSMFCAVGNSATDAHCGAFTTYELLRFELLIRLLVVYVLISLNSLTRTITTSLHATKVRSLTLVALIIGAIFNCIVLKLAKIYVFGVLKTLVLV
jgi:hypothetical protein